MSALPLDHLQRHLESLSDAELLRLSPIAKNIPYCPHAPWPKQRAFLDLMCLEALYGGSAGPGKTDCLLMAALQYVNVPGYAALILRRDFPRLSLPGSIMDRAHSWLANTDAEWNEQKKIYRFPSGAVLQFGYIDNPRDRFRYNSSEFQFIGWDELTEFTLQDGDDANPYQYMFSRLRKPKTLNVPLRVRGATNPGNEGHAYVKKRFVTPAALEAMNSPEVRVFYADEVKRDRAFLPGLIRDNPALDPAEYELSLSHLPPVTRGRLLAGDWSIRQDGVMRPDSFRYYTMQGDYYQLLRPNGEMICPVHPTQCQRFSIIDAAGTSAEVAAESRGKPHSRSVISTYDFCRSKDWLILRDRRRGRWAFPELVRETQRAHADHRPQWVGIEDASNGKALIQTLSGTNVHVRALSHGGKDKLARASAFLNMLEQGKFFTSAEAPWRDAAEAEWFSWTGHPDEQADQIDTDAYAAIHADRNKGGVIQLDGIMFGGV